MININLIKRYVILRPLILMVFAFVGTWSIIVHTQTVLSHSGQNSVTKTAFDNSWVDSILSAGLIVQLVILLLAFLSVMSWAISFSKWKQFRRLSDSDEGFLDFFWKAKSLEDLYSRLGEYKDSSLAHVFKLAYLELQKLATSKNRTPSDSTLELTGLDNLERSIRKAADIEIASMESRLSFLATVGSTGPFIGLFGTVWGIMNSFQKIGATGSASLAVVAPGISEALITTAIGLVTAIPAVILYNHFITVVKKHEMNVSSFSTDLLNIAKRNFFKE